jgi:hypothetical protein
MLKNKPAARLAIYGVVLLILAVLAVLNFYNIITDDMLGQAINAANFIGPLLGVGAVGTAFVNLGRQATNGTFDVPGGTYAEQLAQAAKNYAAQRAKDDAALGALLRDVPGGQAIAEAVTGGDAREVVTACGDALR